MKTIKDILANYGYITKPQLAELNEHFPCMRVVIKRSGMTRERMPAWRAIQRIEDVEKRDVDYCREVFLSSKDCDNLRTAFYIAQ
jgi:hypothetical protein